MKSTMLSIVLTAVLKCGFTANEYKQRKAADVNKYEQLIADFNNTEEPVEG